MTCRGTAFGWWVGTFRDALRDFVLNAVIGASIIPRTVRPILFRALGVSVGVSTFESRVTVVGGWQLSIGDGSFVNTGCVLDASAPIRLGNGVNLAHGVALLTAGHRIGPDDKRAGVAANRPIVIEDGVWVGARATVLGGVRLGRGCVVAAGSVVVSDCLPDGLYAGVPARRHRDLS